MIKHSNTQRTKKNPCDVRALHKAQKGDTLFGGKRFLRLDLDEMRGLGQQSAKDPAKRTFTVTLANRRITVTLANRTFTVTPDPPTRTSPLSFDDMALHALLFPFS